MLRIKYRKTCYVEKDMLLSWNKLLKSRFNPDEIVYFKFKIMCICFNFIADRFMPLYALITVSVCSFCIHLDYCLVLFSDETVAWGISTPKRRLLRGIRWSPNGNAREKVRPRIIVLLYWLLEHPSNFFLEDKFSWTLGQPKN